MQRDPHPAGWTAHLAAQNAVLGYLFLEKAHPRSPGYSGVLVLMRPKPTESHFDPVRVQLFLVEDDKVRSTIFDDQSLSQQASLCPGRIVVSDRVTKHVEFFCFGGQARVAPEPDYTVVLIESPAPIIQLLEAPDSPGENLALEAEAALARQLGEWGLDDRGFQNRMANIDPLTLYTAIVQFLLAQCEESPRIRDCYTGYYHLLKDERSWLEQMHSGRQAPRLNDLFLPEG